MLYKVIKEGFEDILSMSSISKVRGQTGEFLAAPFLTT